MKKNSRADALTSFFEECLLELFEERGALYSAFILEKLKSIAPGSVDSERSGESWQAIESLSRLRSLAGGRFQNLKERWLAAGFPLKGAKEEASSVKLIEKGWLELSNWISNQGFEARLNPERQGIFFEIRKKGV